MNINDDIKIWSCKILCDKFKFINNEVELKYNLDQIYDLLHIDNYVYMLSLMYFQAYLAKTGVYIKSCLKQISDLLYLMVLVIQISSKFVFDVPYLSNKQLCRCLNLSSSVFLANEIQMLHDIEWKLLYSDHEIMTFYESLRSKYNEMI